MSKKNVVFIPFHDEVNIIFDKTPNFTTVVISFLSDHNPIPFPYPVDHFFNIRTECKGDMIQRQIKLLDDLGADYSFVAMYDDDIEIKVSDIEKAFNIAEREKLDLFAPALTHDSHHTYDFTLYQGRGVREVEWVEIMMPHFSRRFISQFKKHLLNLERHNLKSGYGYDVYLFPKILREISGRCAILDGVTARHTRPITSQEINFSNGMSTAEEMNIVHNYVTKLTNQRPS